MKRREFLKSTAAAAGAMALGAPHVANAQKLETVNVGHLVGICMSPLFYAKTVEFFKEEGLDVQMKFMPNPGDALTALTAGAMDIIHNPFTNAFVAAGQGAPVRIIAGSGAGGLFLLAQKEAAIKSMDDLVKAKGKGLKIGTMRFNTFELTLYRAMAKAGVGYSGRGFRGQAARSGYACGAVRDASERSAWRRADRQQPGCLGTARP
jgi:NitT/TauT family transport system substrate-binding protein